MLKHSKLGTKGEDIAAEYLRTKGYKILNRNWRFGQKEIDLIGAMGDMVVFVEIKTRTGLQFGYPEEAVNKQKQRFLKAAAAVYTQQRPEFRVSRFDIIAITLENDRVKEVVHFEEAFH
jgi:putative endonuclease